MFHVELLSRRIRTFPTLLNKKFRVSMIQQEIGKERFFFNNYDVYVALFDLGSSTLHIEGNGNDSACPTCSRHGEMG